MIMNILTFAMMIAIAEMKMVPRYTDKKIINPSILHNPTTSIEDMTSFNSLMNITILRIPTILAELRAKISTADNTLYETKNTIDSERYEFSRGRQITTIKQEYQKAKHFCEEKTTNAGVPTPKTFEVPKLVEIMKEYNVTSQPMATMLVNTDLIMLGSHGTIIDTPPADNYRENLFYLDNKNSIKEMTTDDEKNKKEPTLCLIDRRMEKISEFHRSLFRKNSKLFEQNLIDLSNAITKYLTSRVNIDTASIDNVKDFKIPNAFRYLDHCIDVHKIYSTIYDPQEICIQKLEIAKNRLNNIGDVLQNRITHIKEDFEEITYKRIGYNTILTTTNNPSTIDGKIYEFTGENLRKMLHPFFLYASDQTCNVIRSAAPTT